MEDFEQIDKNIKDVNEIVEQKIDYLLNDDIHDDNVQLKLGKLFLNKHYHGDPLLKNGEKALSWLIKSSRTGNEEATKILQHCYQERIGITNQNEEDVHWCLKTPKWEKKSRKAASKLFRTICHNKSKLTKEEYKERIQIGDISTSKYEKKILERALKEELSEEAFVNRMMRYMNGKANWSSSSLEDLEPEDIKKMSINKKFFYYQSRIFRWIMNTIVESTGNQSKILITSLIPINQAYMFVLLFVYSLISLNTVLFFLPLIGFYISFISIFFCTMQMFYSKRKLHDVKVLSDMLDRFSDNFIEDSAESAYVWSKLKPYYGFFITVPIMIACFYLSDTSWIICGELTILSLVITVSSWFAMKDTYDHLAFMAIVFDAFSTLLPAIVKKLIAYSIIFKPLNYFLNFGFNLNLFNVIQLNLNLTSITFLIVPTLFAEMAAKKSWKGFYQIMIPHLVCFFWWRITLTLFLHTSWNSIFRAVFSWTVITFSIPLLFIPFFIYLYWHLSPSSWFSLLKIFTTFWLIASVAVLAYWARNGLKGSGTKSEKKSSKFNIIISAILIFSCIPIAYFTSYTEVAEDKVSLPASIYIKHCEPNRNENTPRVKLVSHCNHFYNMKIVWSGTVKDVIINNIENPVNNIVNWMPDFLKNWLICMYGIEYAEDCDQINEEFSREQCFFNKAQGRKCHIENQNKMNYEVLVLVETKNYSQTFRLKASQQFTNTLMLMRPEDIISFEGVLSKNLGIKDPVIEINKLSCIDCKQVMMHNVTLAPWDASHVLKIAIKSIFNFFLAPLFFFL